MRQHTLATGQVYHVMNKSIAGFEIFSGPRDYQRFVDLLRFFSLVNPPGKFSQYRASAHVKQVGYEASLAELKKDERQVNLVAYCLMPTHFHLLIQQTKDHGISEFMRLALNAYARAFNTKYGRHGPLFVSRFKSVPVTSDGQLHHVSRYIHLNPVKAKIVRKADNWPFSSYAEYITPEQVSHPLCEYHDLIDTTPADYRKFVNDQADYQQQLASIKLHAIE